MYVFCLTSLFLIKNLKNGKQKPSSKLLWCCRPRTQTAEGSRELRPPLVWASTWHGVSASPNRKLGLE